VVEACDSFQVIFFFYFLLFSKLIFSFLVSVHLKQGAQVTFSSAGGTGAGLGTLLLSKFQENFPAVSTMVHCIVPDTGASPFEYYNTVFALSQLYAYSHLSKFTSYQ
jgi:hypothetical protein